MPRFSVGFGRRRSGADNIDNVAVAGPSFRVLDRSELTSGGDKLLDRGARSSGKARHMSNTSLSDTNVNDNIFARFKGSSNPSTRPSSDDLSGQEERRDRTRPGGRETRRRSTFTDIPLPAFPPTRIPKSASSGLLKSGTFSFGGLKKSLPARPVADDPAPVPNRPSSSSYPYMATQVKSRERATTASTEDTLEPPRPSDGCDSNLSGDFSKMSASYDDKASAMPTDADNVGPAPSSALVLGPAPSRVLNGPRANHLAPLRIDTSSHVEPPPPSCGSQHSDDNLITRSPLTASPNIKNAPLRVSRYPSPLSTAPTASPPCPRITANSPTLRHQASAFEATEVEDEEVVLLRDTLSFVGRFISQGSGGSSPRNSSYSRNEKTAAMSSCPAPPGKANSNKNDERSEEEDMLRASSKTKPVHRPGTEGAEHPKGEHYITGQAKVMTPAEFERYRQDKRHQDFDRQDDASSTVKPEDDDAHEDHYEDDDSDDQEKARQQAKHRVKQEAHMAVYRQQMMKVTGESSRMSHPSLGLPASYSTPDLAFGGFSDSYRENQEQDNEDEDEEVPLAILAAHGFPGKNRLPVRLNNTGSSPDLRASQKPSYQRASSIAGGAAGAGGTYLPAFARNLPQDPFLGAGLVQNPVRESFALGGGSPSSSAVPPIPPGGLVGVIANEERTKAMRRGSPRIDHQIPLPQSMSAGSLDPTSGIHAHIMYPPQATPINLTPGDQTQIQMTQQMQQFMQMQMQFMQMITGQGGNPAMPPNGRMGSIGALSGMTSGHPGMGTMLMDTDIPDSIQPSLFGKEPMPSLPQPDVRTRAMSMVQPISASWAQASELPNSGYLRSIRAQGDGYALSIAPSERNNIGLPGRYRPVSQMPPPANHQRTFSNLTNAAGLGDKDQSNNLVMASGANASDDDDEQGWAAMKAKRDQKKSSWKTKKLLRSELGVIIH